MQATTIKPMTALLMELDGFLAPLKITTGDDEFINKLVIVAFRCCNGCDVINFDDVTLRRDNGVATRGGKIFIEGASGGIWDDNGIVEDDDGINDEGENWRESSGLEENTDMDEMKLVLEGLMECDKAKDNVSFTEIEIIEKLSEEKSPQ